MKLSEQDIEARLRRVLAAVAEVQLDEPLPTATPARRRRAVALAAAAVVIVSVVGLGLARRDEGVTTLADGEAASFHAYLVDDDDAALLFRAEQRLLHRCMTAAGQPYTEVPPIEDALDLYWNRLGRTDALRAERLGYKVPATGGGANPAHEELATASARDDWSAAFEGKRSEVGPGDPEVPIVDPVTGERIGGQTSGGCFGQVQRTLYGDQSRYTSLAQWVLNDVRRAIEEKVEEDPRLHDRIRRWSSCMRERGHDYDHPLDPVHEFGVDGQPSEREPAVAHADVQCKDATELVATYRLLAVEHGRAIVAEHGPLLEEYRRMVDRALDIARQEMRQPPSTITTTTTAVP